MLELVKLDTNESSFGSYPKEIKATRAGETHSKPSWIGSIGLTVGVGVIYFFAVQLSLQLLVNPDGLVAFWLAAGLSSGVLIAYGPGARWPVTAGVIAATISANLVNDRNVWGAIAFAFCNAGEALLVAWIVDRYFGPGFRFGRLCNV